MDLTVLSKIKSSQNKEYILKNNKIIGLITFEDDLI